MSQEINPSAPLVHRPPLPDQHKPNTDQAPATEKQTVATQQPADLLRTNLQKLAAGREYQDDASFKTFSKLGRSLEKMFSEAKEIDRDEGERELKQGGLRRVGKDLRKLFKGLGMPPQLAKHFSRGITEALRDDDIEQVSFSLTSTRVFSLDLQQQQTSYLASGDGSAAAASVSNSFQLTAVQTRSLDVSINLRTGEFALNRSSFDALSVSSSSSTALASFTPAAAETEQGETEQVAASQDDVSAMVQKDESLLQISRAVKQSAIMQLTPATNSEETDDENEELFSDGLNGLRQLVEQLEELTDAVQDMFESLAQISNLRIEHDEEDDDDHLRFTVNAQTPVGLTATDEEGRETTIYPRPDGEIGKITEAEVSIQA